MQFHAHGPEPLTAEAVPAVQRPVVGALVKLAPLDAPHAPFTTEPSVVTVKPEIVAVPDVLPYSAKFARLVTLACSLRNA